MQKLRVLDLFSGIGGFSLGLERTGGFETVAFCEIEPFPRRVLAKHWPEVPCYEDVRTLTAARLAADGIAGVNVITGGFPCQDLSVAGKQRGMGEGTRSGLWSEIVRLTRELRPDYVIVENVAALLAGPSERRGGWFGRVLGDLAECGYDAEWENIPASALGAPHRRERIWIVAWSAVGRNVADPHQIGQVRAPNAWIGIGSEESRERLEEGWDARVLPHASELLGNGGDDYAGIRMGAGPLSQLGNGGWAQIMAHADSQRGCGGQAWQQDAEDAGQPPGHSRHYGRGMGQWVTEPDVGRVANGVPNRAHRLAALGNAVVPQIPELIGHAILQARAAA
jgi:DNA (cytosine-5)-methyltransferase 1